MHTFMHPLLFLRLFQRMLQFLAARLERILIRRQALHLLSYSRAIDSQSFIGRLQVLDGDLQLLREPDPIVIRAPQRGRLLCKMLQKKICIKQVVSDSACSKCIRLSGII